MTSLPQMIGTIIVIVFRSDDLEKRALDQVTTDASYVAATRTNTLHWSEAAHWQLVKAFILGGVGNSPLDE